MKIKHIVRVVSAVVVVLYASAALAATPLLLYKFNEASSGTTPTSILDSSAGTAAPATLGYGTAGHWTSVTAGKGRLYDGTGGDATARVDSGGSITKVQTGLAGSLTATWEIVLDETLSVASYDYYAALVQASSGAEFFTIVANQAQGGLIATFNDGAAVVKFAISNGVHAVDVVADTSLVTPTDRIKIYVDGSLQTVSVTNQIGQNTAIDAGLNWSSGSGTQVQFGEFSVSGNHCLGVNYFAALYVAALDASTVSAHSTALLANNDADPNSGGGPAVQNSLFFGAWNWSPADVISAALDYPLIPWRSLGAFTQVVLR